MLTRLDNSELLDLLFDRMPMGIAVFDRAYRLVRCNPTWLEFVEKYSPLPEGTSLKGKSWFEIAPGTEEQVLPLFEAVLAGETVQREGLRLESGGIRSAWDMVLSPLIRDQHVAGIILVATDATERVAMADELERTAEALRVREERLTFLMESANDGLWDWDLITNKVDFSPRWKHILGYDEEDVAPEFESWQRLIHPADRARVQAAIEAHLAGETEHYQVEHRLRHRDGSYRWILARGRATRDEQGRPVRMAGSHTDITERKKVEAELEARIALENIITGISTQFINLAPDDVDEGMLRALETIGRYTGVDRSYVFLYSGARTEMSCISEWCAEDVEAQEHCLQDIPIEAMAWTNRVIMSGQVLHIPRVADMPPEAEADRREFERQEIRSLVAVPMMYRGEAIGFLGFDAVRAEKTWSEETIALLKIVGEIFVNALENKRSQKIQAGQQQFLELLATGGGFHETLQALVEIIEEQWPGLQALVMLLDEDGQRLHVGAASRLPREYLDAIEGMEIGPNAGSCGTAAYTRQRVIVENIATDPRWEGLRELAQRCGLGSCWSEPVLSSSGEVLGTFAMYYHNRRVPSEAELQTIQVAAHLVGIAIEHKRAQDALKLAYATLEQRVEERTREIEQRRRVAESLGDILGVLNSNRPLNEILDYIVEQSCRMMGADAAVLTRINYEKQWVEFAARRGTPESIEWVKGYPLYAAELTDHTIMQRQPLVMEEPPASLREAVQQDNTPDPGLRAWREVTLNRYRSALTVPLIVKDKVYGSLSFYYEQPTQFSDEDVDLASRFADHTSLAIENARLYEQASEAAAAAERNRLARELHDAVTQTLFSTSLIAEVLPMLWERNRPEGERRLRELRQLTRGALAEMRTLLLELRPTSLLEADFKELLKQLTEALGGRGLVNIELDFEMTAAPPADVKVALYRITQEALNNVLKHARASHVTVSGYCHAGNIELSICDDGQGFDVEAVPQNHLGLTIMRERTEAIGGTLSIDSTVGEGTRIRVRWQQA